MEGVVMQNEAVALANFAAGAQEEAKGSESVPLTDPVVVQEV